MPYIGNVKNTGSSVCLQAESLEIGSSVSVALCDDNELQQFVYFQKRQHIRPLRKDEFCLNKLLKIDWCSDKEIWTYEGNGEIRAFNSNRRCLSAHTSTLQLIDCENESIFQHWSWPEADTDISEGGVQNYLVEK